MLRFLAVSAVLTFLTMPAVARAAALQAETEAPTLTIQIQSVDQLLDNGQYIAGLLGFEDQAKQVIGFVRVLAGPKGIEGVDTQKPFVAYADLAPEIIKSKFVLMIPIADKDSFLALLKNRANLTVSQDKDGLYSTEAPNNMGSIYFRFANGYVYGTFLNKENIAAASLTRPEAVVQKGDDVLLISFRIDRLPEQTRKFAIGGVENALAEAKEKPVDNETQAIKSLKIQTIDCVAQTVKEVMNDGKAFNLKLNIDKKNDQILLDLQTTAKDGTQLSKDFAELKSKKSVAFGMATASNIATFFALNASLPPSVKQPLGPAIDDIVKMGLEKGPLDENARRILGPIVQAAVPTLKSGNMDGGFMLLGPTSDNKYTAVGAGRIVDGKELEKALKDAVHKLPPQEQDMFELDAGSIGSSGAKYSRIKVSKQLDQKSRKVVGDSDLYVAFRNDAAVAAIGPNAKEALEAAFASTMAAGPIFKLEFAIGRLLPLAEVDDEQAAKQAAKEAFGTSPVNDTLNISLDGGDSLTLRAALKGKVIKYIALMQKAKENAASKPAK